MNARESAVLFSVFKNALTPLGASSLSLTDGTSLFVNPMTAADIATLPQAAELCNKYLALSDGDVAITNDPYSGGTSLSEFALVMGVKTESAATDLLLTKRLSFGVRFSLNGKLDDEGVRVPPTPLATKGEVNAGLLMAIASAPLAPTNLADAITKAIDEMKIAAKKLKRLAADSESVMHKGVFKTYLTDSASAFEAAMHKLPLGTSRNTYRFPTGETLKLEVRMGENSLNFDFSGSDASATIALTETATLGACAAAVWSIFDDEIPFNTGSLQHIHVSAPQKTMVSAKFPAGTQRGVTEGVAAVSQLVLETLATLSPKLKEAKSASSPSYVEFNFANSRLPLTVPHGHAAAQSRAGSASFNQWHPFASLLPMPENIEASFPVRCVQAGVRADSGGKGQSAGGHGAVLGVLVKEACEVVRYDHHNSRAAGASSGRAGVATTVEVLRANGDRETIEESSRTIKLEVNDQIHFMSSGGGGFGEPPKGDKEENT